MMSTTKQVAAPPMQCISCNSAVNTEIDYECDICGITEHVQCLFMNDNKNNWRESAANDIEKDLCGKCATNKKRHVN